jgi:uroporphyrinogen-III decarboxylase
MSPEEKNMNSDETKKIRDALEKIVDAIQCLSDAMPREGADNLKLVDTWRALGEARELLGLKKYMPKGPSVRRGPLSP